MQMAGAAGYSMSGMNIIKCHTVKMLYYTTSAWSDHDGLRLDERFLKKQSSQECLSKTRLHDRAGLLFTYGVVFTHVLICGTI